MNKCAVDTKNMLRAIAIAVTMLFCLIIPAYAATYYVDGMLGSDTNSGLEESPWATITRGDHDPNTGGPGLLQPGDTVIVKAGDYGIGYEGGDIKYCSGQPGNPITYKAETGVRLIAIDSPAFRIYGSTTVGQTTYTVSDIVIDGFDISGSYSGVQVFGANRITVQNCFMHDITDMHPGDFAQQRMIDLTDGVSDGCVIQRNILGDISDPVANVWPVGIIGATNTKIYNNTMLKGGCALCQLSGTGTEFKNNIIYGCDTCGMWIDSGASSITHSNNIWYKSGNFCQQASIPADATDLNVDPLFIGGETFDYGLKAASPGVETGAIVPGVAYNGIVPDIGAVESPYDMRTMNIIKGTVTRLSDGKPLVDATVELVGAGLSTTTDAQGKYGFYDVAATTYTVKATMGRAAVQEDVVVTSGPVTKDFTLDFVTKTFYVKPNGDDSANGETEGTAWQTISNGDVKSLLCPGDTVIALPGTYNVQTGADYVALIERCSGTSSWPITYKSSVAPGCGLGAVLQSGNASNGFAIRAPAHGIVIDGFEIKGFQVGVYILWGAKDVEVANCFMGDTTAGGSVDVMIDWGSVPTFMPITDLVVRNNVFRNTAAAAYWHYNIRSHGGVVGMKVYNNTFDTGYSATCLVDWGPADCPGSTVDFTNNIVSNMTLKAFDTYGSNTITHSYNLYYNNASGYPSPLGAGEITDVDPLYVGGTGCFDYNLQQTSSAIDAGTNVGLAYNGVAPDLGALESPYCPSAKTYYVKTNGNDALDGLSLATAWKSIDQGCTRGILRPGDTVLVEPGTYTVTSGDSVALIGNTVGLANLPITFKADGDGVILEGVDGAVYNGLVIYNTARHLVIDGFQIKKMVRGIWMLYGNEDVTIKNCTIGDATLADGWGIAIAWANDPTYVPIRDIKIEHCLFKGVTCANWYDDIRVEGGVDGLKVHNCTFDGGYSALVLIDWGPASMPGNSVEFKNNICSRLGYAAYEFYGSHNVVHENNLFDNCASISNVGLPLGPGEFSGNASYVGGSPFSFKLSPASEAIDAGANLGFAYSGKAPDMGVFESPYTSSITYAGYADLAQIKALTDGTRVQTTAAKIATVGSATFADGSFYVEEANRTCGIKVVPETGGLPSVAPGSVVTFKGIVRTDANGEKYIGLRELSAADGNALGALGMTCKSVALAGGPKTTGLLVRTWGLVTAMTSDYIYVDDGSGIEDVSAVGTGIRVMLSGLQSPITKEFIPGTTYIMGVTGVVGLGEDGIRCIRPRGDSDIDL